MHQLDQLPKIHNPVFMGEQSYVPIFWIDSLPMFPMADYFFSGRLL